MQALDTFRQRLAAGEVIVIDGGMGSVLADRGVPMHQYAWAAPAVLDHYDVVRDTHEDYIRAGAEVVIANTFMASHQALQMAGMDDRFQEINRRSIQAAREARDRAGADGVLIAGALFPGYPGDAEVGDVGDAQDDEAYLASAAREQAAIYAEEGADLVALEMIPTTTWGRLAANAAAEAGLPVWLGVSYGRLVVKDGHDIELPFDPPGDVGAQVGQILEATADADVLAVNLMHTNLPDVDRAFDDIERRWSGVLGAYPHHGEHSLVAPGFHPLPIAPAEYVEQARGWVERGVQIIGGCCGIGVEHIRALKDELPAHIPDGARRPQQA